MPHATFVVMLAISFGPFDCINTRKQNRWKSCRKRLAALGGGGLSPFSGPFLLPSNVPLAFSPAVGTPPSYSNKVNR